jgi:zinc protease
MYPGQPNSRLSSETSLNAITRNDCIACHKAVFRTENALAAVAGDIEKEKFSQKLQRIFPPADARATTPLFPLIAVKQSTTYCIVQKKISQAYIMLGLPLFKRPDTAYYPLSLFNLVLGGDGFTSRLGTSVRSDAGLTYSIYSNAESNYVYPATFFISFFTRLATANKAIAITLREVKKILTDSLTREEMNNGKKNLIDDLPSMFRSKRDIVENYAWNEYYGRADNHFSEYPGKINALQKGEIMSFAGRYIRPEAFTMVITGDTAELFKTGPSDSFSLRQLPGLIVVSPETLYDQSYFGPKKK